MSNTDTFIDEVTEEVRRDRLFRVFRRYGWIGIALVLVVVGGAAITEWRGMQHSDASQDFGDAVLTALDQGDPAARRAALAGIAAPGERAAVLDLLLASDPAEDREGTLAALSKVADDAAQPEAYRDLAVLRRAVVQGAATPVAERRTALELIAAPGRPYRTLAQEQLAYLLAEEGSTDAAIAALRALTVDQEAPQGLRQRARQMIVALGGDTAAG